MNRDIDYITDEPVVIERKKGYIVDVYGKRCIHRVFDTKANAVADYRNYCKNARGRLVNLFECTILTMQTHPNERSWYTFRREVDVKLIERNYER